MLSASGPLELFFLILYECTKYSLRKFKRSGGTQKKSVPARDRLQQLEPAQDA